MKRLNGIIALSLAAVMAAGFAGCGQASSQAQETTVEVTTAAATEAATDEVVKEVNLSKLHEVNYDGNDFAGAWHITGGEGDKYESFVYVFDGGKDAYLVVGTMAYCGHYEINAEIKQFATQLAFGLNGKYTYKLSEDKNTMVLTNTENQAETTLERIMSFSFIPLPEEGASIDDALVGAWADDSGGYLYFDDQGIMYESQKGLSFTFYNYSAEDGVITAKYYMPDAQEDSYKYSVDGETLKYNDYEYKKISAGELV